MIEVRPAVPSLAVRHYRGEGDLPALHRVWSAAAAADGVEEVKTARGLPPRLRDLVNCDLSRDLFLAEVGGDVVAYSRVFWQDLVDGGRSYENFGFVHPAWRGGDRLDPARAERGAAPRDRRRPPGRRAEVARVGERRRRCRRRRPPPWRRLHGGSLLLRDGRTDARRDRRRRCPTVSSCAR